LRFENDIAHLGLFALFSFILFLAGGIDLVTYFQFDKQYGIIPDHLIWILTSLGLIFSPFNPLFDGNWILSLLGGASGAVFMVVLRLISGMIMKRETLGWGDVKLVMSVGFFIGWQGVVGTLMIGSILGSVISLILIWTKMIDRRSALPFGPFLTLGSLIYLFVGRSVLAGFFNFRG
jgi:prepilin signal peptidase PulO-like enzyme (type II secretory pathway)